MVKYLFNNDNGIEKINNDDLYCMPDADLNDPDFIKLAALMKFCTIVHEFLVNREAVEKYRTEFVELYGNVYVYASTNIRKGAPLLTLNNLSTTLKHMKIQIKHQSGNKKFSEKHVKRMAAIIEDELDQMVKDWVKFTVLSKNVKEIIKTLSKLNGANNDNMDVFDLEHLKNRNDYHEYEPEMNDILEEEEYEEVGENSNIPIEFLLKALSRKLASYSTINWVPTENNIKNMFPILWILEKNHSDLVDKKTGGKKIKSCPCPTTSSRISHLCNTVTFPTKDICDNALVEMIESSRENFNMSFIFCVGHRKKMMIQPKKTSERPPKTALNLRKRFNINENMIEQL